MKQRRASLPNTSPDAQARGLWKCNRHTPCAVGRRRASASAIVIDAERILAEASSIRKPLVNFRGREFHQELRPRHPCAYWTSEAIKRLGGVIICFRAPLFHACAHLPCGHDTRRSSEHEDETRTPMFPHNANNTTSKGDDGKRERPPSPPGGIVGQSQRLLVF